MIAIDTSSLVAYLSGQKGADIDSVNFALSHDLAVFPPPVLTEILTDNKLSASIVRFLEGVPIIHLKEGFWQRAGNSRSKLKHKGLKAKLGDTLIAQACIDRDIPLITRDGDFEHFAINCGLILYP